MATMTKAEAGRMSGLQQGERDRMRHAARNLRMCQVRAMGTQNIDIAREVGLSPSRTSRIIAKGEDHWQMWLERAMEEGIEQEGVPGPAPEPDGAERVEMIDIRLIGPNPYQPRTKFTTEQVVSLMESILTDGQRIPIVIRPARYGEILPDNTFQQPYELCWGQLRLEAFREAHRLFVDGDTYYDWIDDAWPEYHDRASGITRIKAIVQDIDDTELRRGALIENLQRNDMAWSDTIRALDSYINSSDSTAAAAAKLAGMSPEDLSNQRRLLRLPRVILDMVDDGVLAWTSARQLLVFTSAHHTHDLELDYCVNRLTAKMRRDTDPDGNRKRIGGDSVRTVVTNALSHSENHRHWEPLIDSNYIYMGDGNPHGKRRPKFDIEAFAKLHREHVHKIPRRYHAGTEEWTCAVESWRTWQTAAEDDERKAEEERKDQEEFARQLNDDREFSIENTALPGDDHRSKRYGPIMTALVAQTPEIAHLPQTILDMCEEGRLGHNFVIWLTGFVSTAADTCNHRAHLDHIAGELQRLSQFKSPDKRMSLAVCGGVVLKSLKSDIEHWQFRSLDDRLTAFGFEAPHFDTDEFANDPHTIVHFVPIGTTSGPETLIRVTCSAVRWRTAEQAATEAVQAQVARGNTATPPAEEPAAQLMDMAMVDSGQLLSTEAGMSLLAAADALEPWVNDDQWRAMGIGDVRRIAEELARTQDALTPLLEPHVH